jgi:allophanate hydrolase subunit 2
VPVTLGSGSRDTLSGLGPAPLAVGDVIPVGRGAVALPHVDQAAVRPASGPLRVVLGPRDDWFTADAVRTLLSTPWAVTSAADRVGIRLDGPALTRRDPARELPSEPVVTGSLQVPPDGRPVLLGPDHPTTGGYPVIAVVVDADLDRVAQAVPGQILDVREVNPR